MLTLQAVGSVSSGSCHGPNRSRIKPSNGLQEWSPVSSYPKTQVQLGPIVGQAWKMVWQETSRIWLLTPRECKVGVQIIIAVSRAKVAPSPELRN